MEDCTLPVAGLLAAVIVLVIGVYAASHQIPYALEIIGGALGAIALLIRAISNKVDPPRNRNNRNDRRRAD